MPALIRDPSPDVAPAGFSLKLSNVGFDEQPMRKASEILSVISRYELKKTDKVLSRADEGAIKFLAMIYTQVKSEKPIRMCLPAFPFKSPNTQSKVLGRLPDKAEEFALAHLNGLCAAIGDIYPPGAELTIISDGLVYNGAVSQPEMIEPSTPLTDMLT